MINWIKKLLYGFTQAEFESSFGLEASVNRLASATGRSLFPPRAHQMAAGRVTSSYVSLHRYIPTARNSFKPFFLGYFGEINGRVVLRGIFTMHRFVKVFMSFWLAFCLFLTIADAITSILGMNQSAWWSNCLGLAMFFAGLFIVWIGKWFARNDIAWLSNVIHKALTEEPPGHVIQADAVLPDDASR